MKVISELYGEGGVGPEARARVWTRMLRSCAVQCGGIQGSAFPTTADTAPPIASAAAGLRLVATMGAIQAGFRLWCAAPRPAQPSSQFAASSPCESAASCWAGLSVKISSPHHVMPGQPPHGEESDMWGSHGPGSHSASNCIKIKFSLTPT
ncbi:unnamed protein product [Lampetra fluviatilis]